MRPPADASATLVSRFTIRVFPVYDSRIMESNFKVGLIQMSTTPNPDQNLDRAVQFIHQAREKGADVICLPELFRSQYFCQKEDAALFDLAETIPGPSTEAISQAARKLKVTVIAPIFEKRAAGLYHNSLAIIDEAGRVAGIYRK